MSPPKYFLHVINIFVLTSSLVTRARSPVSSTSFSRNSPCSCALTLAALSSCACRKPFCAWKSISGIPTQHNSDFLIFTSKYNFSCFTASSFCFSSGMAILQSFENMLALWSRTEMINNFGAVFVVHIIFEEKSWMRYIQPTVSNMLQNIRPSKVDTYFEQALLND